MDEELRPGDDLRGRYEIQRLLKVTRDKRIYLAHDQVLDLQVVITVFVNNSTKPSGLTPSAWEARVLAYLGDNPNIVTALDYWEEKEKAAIVIPYLAGGNLFSLIIRSDESGERLPVESILRLSTEMATALSCIHRRRILYLDLQPHNVLFDEWGTVHLVDFDTAVSLDDHDMSELSHRSVNNYMAPELIEGRKPDERADLYSLGVTIYEMCQGHLFTGSREKILTTRRAGSSTSLERSHLPETLRDLVHSLLAPDREQRPPSADDVVRRLNDICTAWVRIVSNIKTVEAVINLDLNAVIKLPHGVQSRSTFTKMSPEIGLSRDHLCLILAIIALAEADHRQAVIDAGTATEIALKLAISDKLRAKELSSKCIDLIVRRANGLVGLLALYTTFEDASQISEEKVKGQLANVRNGVAHDGRIPTEQEATHAVQIARTLVSAVHAFDLRALA